MGSMLSNLFLAYGRPVFEENQQAEGSPLLLGPYSSYEPDRHSSLIFAPSSRRQIEENDFSFDRNLHSACTSSSNCSSPAILVPAREKQAWIDNYRRHLPPTLDLPSPSFSLPSLPDEYTQGLSRSHSCGSHHSPSSNLNTPSLYNEPPAEKRTPAPPILSPEVLALADSAFSVFETVRKPYLQKWPESPHLSRKSPLVNLTVEELRAYFAAAIDAKNAINLRKSATILDIGEALGVLLPNLTLYDRDTAVLDTINEEIRLIKEECTNRQLELNFYALEYLRYLSPPHQQSIIEAHSALFSSVEDIVYEKDDVRQVARCFLQDPSALREHRLPRFQSSPR